MQIITLQLHSILWTFRRQGPLREETLLEEMGDWGPALSAVMIARSANTCKHLSMGLLYGLGVQAASSLFVKLSLVLRCACGLRQGLPGSRLF